MDRYQVRFDEHITPLQIAASAEFRECESAFSAVDSELLDIISKKERVFASGQKVNAR